jgi:peptidoglycan/LPS O-acetylase OafA/YrhL
LPFFSDWESGPKWLRKPVELISEISYSIYLLHYSIVLYLMKHFIDTSTFSLMQLHLFTLLYISTTLFLSYLLYQCFERPMTKLRDKRL